MEISHQETTGDELRIKVEKERHYCHRCQTKTSHLVVNSGEENCWSVCQICSKGRCW